MAPDERAQRNHDELFPGHVSTLAVTDPEFIETWTVLVVGATGSIGRLVVDRSA